MKRNLFGLTRNTVGQNVMRYVLGCEQPIGILEYNYSEMKQILSKAMTPFEYRLISLGYGIDCQRIDQKQIAVELGISEIKVSEIGHKAMNKVKASPYKVQLEALIPTAREISQRFAELEERLEKAEASSKALKETKYRLEASANQLKTSESRRKQLETENAHLSYENEQKSKRLAKAQTEVQEMQAKVAEMVRQSDSEKAKVNDIIEAFCNAVAHLEEGIHCSVEETMKSLTGLVANASITSLEELNLSTEASRALNRVGVNTITGLCKMSFRSLTSMVGKKHATEIRGKLQNNGLTLAG